MSDRPEGIRLRFEREGLGLGRSLVELRDGRLVLNASGYGHDENVYTLVDPPPERWVAFWKMVESLGVWSWEPKYYRPILDGSSWSLQLQHEGRRLSSTGSNAWPERFDQFSRAVNTLVADLSAPVEGQWTEVLRRLRDSSSKPGESL